MKMIGSKCILDTSVIIHFFKKNSEIIQSLHKFEEIYVSSIAIGELYYGAYASSNIQKHIEQIQSFIGDCIVVVPGINTSLIYGKIKSDLKRKGTPVPENDIWIAAVSIEHNIPLFTTDKHFGLIELDLI